MPLSQRQQVSEFFERMSRDTYLDSVQRMCCRLPVT